MSVIHHDRGDNCLTMSNIRAVVCVRGRKHFWPAVLKHVFRFHWKVSWRWIFEAKCTRQVKVCLEEWVKAEFGAELQPVVYVHDVMIVLVDNVNIPTHQIHL
jgi:hypothetical protein